MNKLPVGFAALNPPYARWRRGIITAAMFGIATNASAAVLDCELNGEHGYLDAHGSVTASGGGNVTTDPFGNMTATGGLRGAMEIGAEGQWDLANGGNLAFDASV